MKRTNVIFIAVISVVFIYYFGIKLGYSAPLSWVIFLPLEFIRRIVDLINLKEDFKIIYLLLVGIPLLILYWFGCIKLFASLFGILFRKN